ncbi:hypothetical protein [Thermodesulfatator indicus]
MGNKKISISTAAGQKGMLEMENKYINIALRLLLNFIFFSFYPTFIIILYFAKNDIFPYDFFLHGKFALDIFFYFSFLISIFLFFFISSPVIIAVNLKKMFQEIREAKIWYKKLFHIIGIIYAVMVLMLILLALWLLFFSSKNNIELSLALMAPVMAVVLTTLFALKLNPKKFFIFSLSTYIALLAFNTVKIEYTEKFISTSLRRFGVGGLLDAKIIENHQVESGKLIFLAPNSIFLKNKDGKIVILKNGQKIEIKLHKDKNRKK